MCINKHHVVLWQCVHTTQPSLVVDLMTLHMQKEANQCDMDASSASINWLNTTWFLCGNMVLNPPPPDVIPGTTLGGKDKTG